GRAEASSRGSAPPRPAAGGRWGGRCSAPGDVESRVVVFARPTGGDRVAGGGKGRGKTTARARCRRASSRGGAAAGRLHRGRARGRGPARAGAGGEGPGKNRGRFAGAARRRLQCTSSLPVGRYGAPGVTAVLLDDAGGVVLGAPQRRDPSRVAGGPPLR